MKVVHLQEFDLRVNALSGLYLIVTQFASVIYAWIFISVNALSGLYLIVTQSSRENCTHLKVAMCQCPLGLIPHCYVENSSA